MLQSGGSRLMLSYVWRRWGAVFGVQSGGSPAGGVLCCHEVGARSVRGLLAAGELSPPSVSVLLCLLNDAGVTAVVVVAVAGR